MIMAEATDRNPTDLYQESSSSDDQSSGQSASIRSYECNFCKRGFTNAQALGGHMNIHRKEKAKLKQAASLNPNDQIMNAHNHISNNLDIQKRSHDMPAPPSSYISPVPMSSFLPLEATKSISDQEFIRISMKLPNWINPPIVSDQAVCTAVGIDQNPLRLGDQVRQQLPLFTEMTANIERNFENIDRHKILGTDQKISSGSSHGSLGSEVDLELRLGPEPLPEASAAAPTGSN